MVMVDSDQFWKDDEMAHADNCFNESAPQVALGIQMENECVFAELDVEGDQWSVLPREERIELNKRYNDKAEKIVGRRLLQEFYPSKDEEFPYVKRIGEVFGGAYTYGHKTGEWLHSDIDTPKKLEELLDYVDKMDLREFILPDTWESEKKRIYETYGNRPSPIKSVRGPVTLGMSIYGIENLVYLYYDAFELFERFSQSICRVILEIGKIMALEAGHAENEFPVGFSFFDDNCALLTPEMYEIFGYPVLKSVFECFSPNKGDTRYQHSDSEMAHILPILARLNLTGCNFGPTVLVDEIRKYMPKTRIDGCIAPFTFMSNDKDKIIKEVKRDCEMIKNSGTKGLNIYTAGSINNGSSLESMRVVMYAIQNFGRY